MTAENLDRRRPCGFRHARPALLTAFAVLSLLATCPTVHAQEYVEVPDPARVPQRIILSWVDNPATTQAVTWRTVAACESPQAQIMAAAGTPLMGENAETVPATRETLKFDADATHYSVNFTGLAPNTQYAYRVGDGEVWSEWFQFTTASDAPAPFRFIYVGDAQNDIKALCSRTFRQAFAAAPDARLMVHAGDLVAEGYDDALWGEWCHAMGFITAMVPSVPTPGNHDKHQPPTAQDPEAVLSVDPLYRAHFTLPMNGPEGVACLEEEAYYIDYQGVRFISLDSNVYANDDFVEEHKQAAWDAQLDWLEGVLSDNPNRWTIVTHHHPLYSGGKDRNNVALRDALLPLYDKYRVDLVLQGHDHVYARTHKLSGDETVAPDAPGTVYVVSVSGRKMYEVNPLFTDLMVKVLPDTQAYQVVDVEEMKLTLHAYDASGEFIDGFELRKDTVGKSTLRNLVSPQE